MSIITSSKNAMVQHFMKLRLQSAYRKEHQRALIMGTRMVTDVCKKIKTHSLLLKTGEKPPNGIEASKIYYVPTTILEKISALTSQQMAAEVEMPKIDTTTRSLSKQKLVLVLDRIADPGNMGTLIRSAHNLGWDGICIVGDSVDPFNDKALRGAKGFTFLSNITILKSWDTFQGYLSNKKSALAFVAEVHSKNGETNFKNITQNKSPPNFSVADQIFLVLSHESTGASPVARESCQPISIPMGPDSLSSGINVGVAGGILMWSIKQWQQNKPKPK